MNKDLFGNETEEKPADVQRPFERLVSTLTQTFNEDCMVVMARYPDKYFDLAVVDPPYRDENKPTAWMKNNSHDDMNNFGGKPKKEYFLELDRVARQHIIWGANNFGIDFKGFIVWDKKIRGSRRYS